MDYRELGTKNQESRIKKFLTLHFAAQSFCGQLK